MPHDFLFLFSDYLLVRWRLRDHQPGSPEWSEQLVVVKNSLARYRSALADATDEQRYDHHLRLMLLTETNTEDALSVVHEAITEAASRTRS